jgi:hypothetical protein
MNLDEAVALRQAKTQQFAECGFESLSQENLATWIQLAETVAAGATADDIGQLASGLSAQEIAHLAGIWKTRPSVSSTPERGQSHFQRQRAIRKARWRTA